LYGSAMVDRSPLLPHRRPARLQPHRMAGRPCCRFHLHLFFPPKK
jgi:hypothetical protein